MLPPGRDQRSTDSLLSECSVVLYRGLDYEPHLKLHTVAMATTRNLALEEQGISKKLFWGQFCALTHNNTASSRLGLEDAL